jgi:hypothetical protein
MHRSERRGQTLPLRMRGGKVFNRVSVPCDLTSEEVTSLIQETMKQYAKTMQRLA